ncbi:hypothetical protein PENTCL1PPCAC_18785 [Pristionchus entomophagus]|uniref:Uncharacterized protein n=1 Tax=Pristionchus entomophagus TaxID=358040 RepID=A0AAV5TQ96_9BILA|nr:hypothetical protein PENTCL1PPCAC_18785 [Pristionchus entomophagus]
MAPCIMMYAQIDLTLSYMTDDDSLAEAETITVLLNRQPTNRLVTKKFRLGTILSSRKCYN